MGSVPFALQLYTVRDHLERDVPGTLKRVKDAGYDYVELAGMGPYGPREYSALLAGAGLTAISSHFGFEEITKNTSAVIETVQALGVANAVVSWVGGAMCPDKAHWVACAKAMDEAGAQFRAAVCNHRQVQLMYQGKPREYNIHSFCLIEAIPMSFTKCSTKKPGSKFLFNIRGAILSRVQHAAAPPDMPDNMVFISSPALYP